MKLKELEDSKCECGFQFAKAGEFRNSRAYQDTNYQWHIVCPDCTREYDAD